MSNLPIREMVLYKHGIGFFVRSGQIEGDTVTLSFNEVDINDILKSLSIHDRAGGKVLSIDYETPLTRAEQLANSTINLSDNSSQHDLIRNLRGRPVQLTVSASDNASRTISGQIVGLEIHSRQTNVGEADTAFEFGETFRTIIRGTSAGEATLMLLTEDNEVHFFPISAVQDIDITDDQSIADLRYFLDVIKNNDNRQTITIRLNEGRHDLVVRYVAPSPTWRVSYRVVADSETKKLQLQGWGLFDNRLDEPLEDIELTLVAGQPISFIYDLYKSEVPQRPRIQDEARIAQGPVEYSGQMAWLQQDQAQEELQSARRGLNRLSAPMQDIGDAGAADIRHKAALTSAARPVPGPMPATLPAVRQNFLNNVLSNNLTRPSELREALNNAFVEEGVVMNEHAQDVLFEELTQTLIEAGHDIEVEDMFEALASGEARGEFFQYRVQTPVSAGRGASTLVPILTAKVDYDKELLYNGSKLPEHPTVTLHFKNASGLTLERGPVTVVEDNDYKGEGIIPYTQDQQDIYLPFAVELNVRVTEQRNTAMRTTGVRIGKGVLAYEQYNVQQVRYSIENALDRDITLTIEATILPNYTLFDTPEPVTETATERRWQLEIPARTRREFRQQTRRRLHRHDSLYDLTELDLQRFIANKWIDQALFDELKVFLDKLALLQRYRRGLEELERTRHHIYEQQKQLRENLQALPEGEEAAPLRTRLLTKLNDAQDKLDEQAELEQDLRTRIKDLEAEIAQVIEALGKEEES